MSDKNPVPAPAYNPKSRRYSASSTASFNVASRMGRHQIRYQILLLSQAFYYICIILFSKIPDKLYADGFPIFASTVIRHMLRCHLQLPAHMIIRTALLRNVLIRICQHIIKSDARTDKYFLHFRNLPKFSKQGKIISE